MKAMSAEGCALVLVDYQARLMLAIHDVSAVTARVVVLARAALALGVPVIGTEENPASLGQNVEEVRSLCAHSIGKTHFDACADGLLEAVQSADVVAVAGCEAHVCLLQTTLGLLRAGKRVWVVENACGSRRPMDHAAAMRRLAAAGATVVTHGTVLFEWLADCRHPQFKELLNFIKAAP